MIENLGLDYYTINAIDQACLDLTAPRIWQPQGLNSSRRQERDSDRLENGTLILGR